MLAVSHILQVQYLKYKNRQEEAQWVYTAHGFRDFIPLQAYGSYWPLGVNNLVPMDIVGRIM